MELATHSNWPEWDQARRPTLVIHDANGTMPERKPTQMQSRRPAQQTSSGEEAKGRAGHVQPSRVDEHTKPPVETGFLGREPTYQGFRLPVGPTTATSTSVGEVRRLKRYALSREVLQSRSV